MKREPPGVSLAAEFRAYSAALAGFGQAPRGVDSFATELAATRDPAARAALHKRADLLAVNLADPEALVPARLIDRAVSLGSLLRDGIPPVEYLAGRLADHVVYAVGVTAFSGHPGSGKTTVCQRLALDYLETGGHVVYLDWEGGERDVAARLNAMGADPDVLDARLHYLAFPALEDWAQVQELWERWPGALGVWDSMKGALGALSLDEDRAKDVQRFTQPLLQLAKEHQCAHLMVDHVTKADDGKGTYAGRGSGVKLADVEGLWYVAAVRDFSQSEVGEVHLTRKRARPGALRPLVRLEVGDGNGGLPIRELDETEATTPAGRIRRDVLAFLREHPGERFTKTAVRESKSVRGEKRIIDSALAELAAERGEPVHAERDGRATWYWYEEDRTTGSEGLEF